MVFGKRVAVAALVLVSRSFGSAEPAAQGGSDSIQWRPLIEQSMYFLGIQHGFRLATEKGTRRGFEGPYLRNVAKSVGSLRGWSDGDLALVNYVGHPMQGAVSAYIFAQNDPRYRRV